MITAEDRLEIDELASRYNQAIDLGDPAGWVECFLADGEFRIESVGLWTASAHNLSTGTWRGTTQLTAFAEVTTTRGPFRHWSYNRVLTPVSDGIGAISYMNVYYLQAPPEKQLVTGVMRDLLRKPEPGGRWHFASRRISFDR